MSDYFDYSTGRLTAGTTARAGAVNTILDEIDTGLAKLPSEANLKRGLINYASDSGAANAYVVTLTYAPTSYTDGMEVVFKASAVNTTASTINVNSLGAKSIKRGDGTALVAGDIPANKIITLRYNSTSGDFEIQGGISSTGAGTMASQNANSVAITGGSVTGITDLAVADGGTGSSTASGALTNLGLTASAAEINGTCDGNTATAAEITAVCDGNTATAEEITAVCDGNTATASELSELHSQGCVAADFAKLHAITRSAAQINDKVGETFVNAADGGPYISSTSFSIGTLTNASWESIGPTGSGADNIWTALDGIPTDVDWIELRITGSVSATSEISGTNESVEVYLRKYGSAVAKTAALLVLYLRGYVNAAGDISMADVSTVRVPVLTRTFEAYRDNLISAAITVFLVGYGYNP